jgi:cell division transport system ATP-binding protein
VIWLEGVSLVRGDQPVLENVTLGVAEGELVTVFGPHAAGKSTLIDIAATQIAPTTGSVWFAGKNLSTLQRASLPYVRRNIGVHSDRALVLDDDTVFETILLALGVRGEALGEAENAALNALTLLEIADLRDRKLATLSLGQRRMATLARAIAGPPKLVIADEPGMGVGGDVRKAVVRALNFARQERAAVLCATADERLASELSAIGGRKVHLDHGRIAGAPPMGLVPTLDAKTTPRLIVLDVDEGDHEPAMVPMGKDPA